MARNDEQETDAPEQAEPARPARTEEELGRMRSAHARYQKRHKPVTAEIGQSEDGRTTINAPHDDLRGWLFRLQDATGTASDEFALTQLTHLTQMVPATDAAPRTKINAMLAAVDGVRPETEAEGMLAVQMAATHHAAMVCLQRAACSTSVQLAEAHGNLATKMLRTYTTQLETLAKLRRGGSQKVTVEHVHVYAGGQAVVGNVAHAPAGGGGLIENGQQAHAPLDPRALALALSGPLLCQDPARVVVPVAGRERKDPVPHARRSKGQRRTQG